MKTKSKKLREFRKMKRKSKETNKWESEDQKVKRMENCQKPLLRERAKRRRKFMRKKRGKMRKR